MRVNCQVENEAFLNCIEFISNVKQHLDTFEIMLILL